MMTNQKRAGLALALLLAATSPGASGQTATSSDAVSMREAIAVAMQSNPEILAAQFNKEAIEFERKQAQGRFLPRVDVETSAGVRRLENTTRRTLGIADQKLFPLEFQGRGEWTLLDGGTRRGELLRQAARVDGASLRVVETLRIRRLANRAAISRPAAPAADRRRQHR